MHTYLLPSAVNMFFVNIHIHIVHKCAILSFSVINSFPFPQKIPKLHFMNRIRFRYLVQSTNIILYMNKIKFSVMIESLYCICNKPSFLMSSIIQFKSTCTNLNTNIIHRYICINLSYMSNLVMFIDRNCDRCCRVINFMFVDDS